MVPVVVVDLSSVDNMARTALVVVLVDDAAVDFGGHLAIGFVRHTIHHNCSYEHMDDNYCPDCSIVGHGHLHGLHVDLCLALEHFARLCRTDRPPLLVRQPISRRRHFDFLSAQTFCLYFYCFLVAVFS